MELVFTEIQALVLEQSQMHTVVISHQEVLALQLVTVYTLKVRSLQDLLQLFTEQTFLAKSLVEGLQQMLMEFVHQQAGLQITTPAIFMTLLFLLMTTVLRTVFRLLMAQVTFI